MTDTSFAQGMAVLVVDDSPVQRLLLKNCLAERGFSPILTNNGEDALAVLQAAEAPRLVVIDWVLPGISGIEVCRKIRSGNPERYTYIVLLTSKSESAHVVAGLESGADDFVRKPFDSAELGARLATGCRILQLEEQLVIARDKLQEAARFDSLTGLLNRGAIIDHLQKELARAIRQQTTVGLMMLDLDHFKLVNDTFGHLIGDQVLKRVGYLLQGNFRAYDAAGRFGGEEFLIVVPICGNADLQRRAEMLRVSIAHLEFECEGQMCSPSVSIGVATFDPKFPEGLESLLQRCDAALYEAKNSGRNQVKWSRSLSTSGEVLTFL